MKRCIGFVVLGVSSCTPIVETNDVLPYPTTPPAGGICGRDWNTFDPDKVYVTGTRLIDRIDEYNDGACVVVDLDDMQAVAGGYRCTPYRETSFIRASDGRIVQEVDDGDTPTIFVADVSDFDDDTGRCTEVVDTNDERLPIVACADKWAFNSSTTALRLLPAGGYVYTCEPGIWHSSDGSTRDIVGEVVAFNDAEDALVFSDDEPPSVWHLVRNNGDRVPVTGLPARMLPAYTRLSTRVDGVSFIVLVVEGSQNPFFSDVIDLVHRYVIDGSGVAREEGIHAVDNTVRYDSGRFDADGAFIAIAVSSNLEASVVRLPADGSAAEALYATADTDLDRDERVSPWSLVSGP